MISEMQSRALQLPINFIGL